VDPFRLARAATALALAATCLAAAASYAAPRVVPAGRAPGYDATATARLYAEVNAHRAAHGLRTLTVDSRLEDVARTWTARMAATGTLAHNDALFTPAAHQAMGISYFGENVGDTWDPARFTPMFLASPHHRENIEYPGFAVAGFAVVLDAKGQYWATEDFGGAPRATAPVAPAPRPVAAPVRHVVPPPAPAPKPRRVVARAATRSRAVARPVVVRHARFDRTPSPEIGVVTGAAATPEPRPASRTGWVVVAALLLALVAGSGARASRRGRLAA
jgi:uncharacterized protein YkwD